jgi:protein TIF31
MDASSPFEASDMLNLQPVVKHSVPTCTDAKNLMEAGKVRMAEVYSSVIFVSDIALSL